MLTGRALMACACGTRAAAGTNMCAALVGSRVMKQPPPFRLTQLDHVVLRVRDLATMQAFYCDVLGCEVERRQDELGLLQLRAGASLIDLVAVEGTIGRAGGAAPGAAGRNMDHFCLQVAPFDSAAIRAYLDAHAVRDDEFDSRLGG